MAVTTVGEVLTLKLRAVNEDESLIDFNVPEADADTLDSGEESLPQVKIMESGRVKLGMDAATICTGRSGTFIGSSSGDIAMISWDLTVKYRINLQEHLLQNNYLRQLGAFEHQGDAEEALRAGKGINALDFCRNRSLLAVVTKSGVALLLIVAKDEPPDPVSTTTESKIVLIRAAPSRNQKPVARSFLLKRYVRGVSVLCSLFFICRLSL